jgi:hypothetical protein
MSIQPDKVDIKKVSMTVYPPGVRIQIAPDDVFRSHIEWPDHVPFPMVGIFDWVERQGGGWEPKIKPMGIWVPLADVFNKTINLGLKYQSLRRLINAGFVKSRQLTPGRIEFNFQSFLHHCNAVQSDSEFWRDKKNLRRYMEAIE